ncbi:MAG: threonine/serine exporter family protein [Lachnospiraceae bacterium]|nr:threonine/serine exporter family protein [Lachnospiraceae bacterium]
MDYRKLADTAMLAGTIMLRGGAETNRVEDTMQRILNTSGAGTTEVLVLSTALMLTIDDPSISAISKMQRISSRGTNIGNICVVNQLSRQYCGGEISLDEMYQELKLLKEANRYPEWLCHVCTMLTVVMFTLLLGGKTVEALLSVVSAVVLVVFQILVSKLQLNPFMFHMASLACATFFVTALVGGFSIPCNLELIIAGTAMPSLPGVAITNAIRDTLHGDYISGSARVMEAFVRAISCAVGIGAGLYLGSLLTGGVL